MHLGQLLCSLTEHVECSDCRARISLLLPMIDRVGQLQMQCASVMLSDVGRLRKKPRTKADDLSLQVLRNVRKEGTKQASRCRAVRESD